MTFLQYAAHELATTFFFWEAFVERSGERYEISWLKGNPHIRFLSFSTLTPTNIELVIDSSSNFS